MAKIKNVNVSFTASTSPDVVGYKLYMTEAGTSLSYTSESFNLGTSTSFNMSTLPGVTDKDGVFNLGIVAIDDAGNESDMAVAENVALDFVAPDAPVEVTVTRS
jgi:hypothetical protein